MEYSFNHSYMPYPCLLRKFDLSGRSILRQRAKKLLGVVFEDENPALYVRVQQATSGIGHLVE